MAGGGRSHVSLRLIESEQDTLGIQQEYLPGRGQTNTMRRALQQGHA